MDSTTAALHLRERANFLLIANRKLICVFIPQSVFKYHINLQFNISDDEKFQHRAIQLQPRSNGMMNYAGQWMCSVSTYQTSDRQIKTMIVIGKP